MKIIYKDESIVVCIKPSGILSAKDASGKNNMSDALCEQLNLKTVYPIHRLDREASGIMVYALTAASAARLSVDAGDHTRFVKEYMAVISGIPNEKCGILEDLLFKDSSKNKSFVVNKERRGVKRAKLSYEVLEECGERSLVKIKLFTGRTHQIRVQFSSRKMPLVGDRKYGGPSSEKGIALYSVKLSFYHPETNEQLCFEHTPNINIKEL